MFKHQIPWGEDICISMSVYVFIYIVELYHCIIYVAT